MKYKKITQKPFCCVGACLEMILNRNHIPNCGQIEIACELGLIVPESYKEIYKNARFGEKPTAGYGTQINKKEYSINSFFQKNHINLKEEYYFITQLEVVRKFILENERNDILICCHAKTLYNSKEEDWGHMLLLEKIEGDHLILLDPEVNRDDERVPLERVIKAISVHGKENGAGFYLIKPQ